LFLGEGEKRKVGIDKAVAIKKPKPGLFNRSFLQSVWSRFFI